MNSNDIRKDIKKYIKANKFIGINEICDEFDFNRSTLKRRMVEMVKDNELTATKIKSKGRPILIYGVPL